MVKLTWQEMKQQFPDEWLLIVDYELDAQGRLTSGTVKKHSKKKGYVFSLPSLNQSVAFRFAGAHIPHK